MPAFKPPEAKNAADTMIYMAVLLGVIFIGVTVVANAYGIVPSVGGAPSVVSLVAGATLGFGSPLYTLFLVATMLILFLAANTSYNAFPRLAAILAEDGYMPRQFAFRGDRLAYSWGIVLLAAVAIALLVAFGGTTTLLIPLYSVGVFVCFTLSQTGMVRHWLRTREAGWQWRLGLNAFGAVLTAVVLVIVFVEKFTGGAYLVGILIPVLVGIMLFIHRQYQASRRQLAILPDAVIPTPHREERVIIPVAGLDRAVVQAINVARSITDDVRAVFISDEPERAADVRARWEHQVPGVPLGHRGVPVSGAHRPAAGVPRRPRRGVAAGQGGPHHLRRRARVRGAQLVGADPLQPVGEAAAHDPPRPAEHRRRQRALPARGARPVRAGTRDRGGTRRVTARSRAGARRHRVRHR